MTTARQKALLIERGATCRIESEPGKIPFAIVRDAVGLMIGRHRTTLVAWECAFEVLSGARPRDYYAGQPGYRKADK